MDVREGDQSDLLLGKACICMIFSWSPCCAEKSEAGLGWQTHHINKKEEQHFVQRLAGSACICILEMAHQLKHTAFEHVQQYLSRKRL